MGDFSITLARARNAVFFTIFGYDVYTRHIHAQSHSSHTANHCNNKTPPIPGILATPAKKLHTSHRGLWSDSGKQPFHHQPSNILHLGKVTAGSPTNGVGWKMIFSCSIGWFFLSMLITVNFQVCRFGGFQPLRVCQAASFILPPFTRRLRISIFFPAMETNMVSRLQSEPGIWGAWRRRMSAIFLEK